MHGPNNHTLIVIPLFLLVCARFAAEKSDTNTLLLIQDSIEAGDFEGASHHLAQELTRRPKDGGLFNLRGVIHARQGEMAMARADFGVAVHLDPALTPAWQNLGRACQHTAEMACAVQAWERVLQTKPSDSEAHRALAELFSKQGKFAESMQQLDAVRPDDLALRCLDLSSLGRVTEARTVATQLGNQTEFTETDLDAMHGALDLPKSAAVLAELIETMDARGAAGVPGLRRLILAYEQLQRPADATRTLERVAKLQPNETADLLELARLAEQSKNYEAALGYLAHARDLQPGNARIHFLFGLIAGELDLPLEAKRSLERALAIDPGNPEYKYAMGTVILKTRDAATASTYFQDFVNAHPADAKGHYALGLAFFAAGDYKHSKEQMEISERDSRMAGAADYYLGRIARLSGQMNEAMQRLRSSSQLMPSFSETHTELARIALLQGSTEQAQAELSTALRLAPDSFQANQQLLVLYRRTHDARADQQAEVLKKLDEDRSKRAELMLRTIEVRP